MWRIVLPALALIAQSPPARACEASATGSIGEVSVTRSERGLMAVWLVARVEGVGEESDYFARPGLELEFKLNPDGELGELAGAFVPITRVSDSRIGEAPSLDQVTVKARFDGKALSWRGDKAADGQVSLAFALLKQWPSTLVIDIAPPQGRPLHASATFDLSKRPAAQDLARQALAKCRG